MLHLIRYIDPNTGDWKDKERFLRAVDARLTAHLTPRSQLGRKRRRSTENTVKTAVIANLIVPIVGVNRAAEFLGKDRTTIHYYLKGISKDSLYLSTFNHYKTTLSMPLTPYQKKVKNVLDNPTLKWTQAPSPIEGWNIFEKKWEEEVPDASLEGAKRKLVRYVVHQTDTADVKPIEFDFGVSAHVFHTIDGALTFLLRQNEFPVRFGVELSSVDDIPKGRRVLSMTKDSYLYSLVSKEDEPNCEIKSGYLKTLRPISAGERLTVIGSNVGA